MSFIPKRLMLPALVLVAVLVGLSIIHFSPSAGDWLFRNAAGESASPHIQSIVDMQKDLEEIPDSKPLLVISSDSVPERTTTTSQPTTTMDPVTAGSALHKILVQHPLSYECKTIKQLKNRVEGSWSYCADPTFLPKKPCLVYSFGINFDFTFDDAFGDMGCEVLSFDPSMNKPDHRHNKQVMFYNLGLGSADNDSLVPRMDSYVRKKTYWKMRTLKSILKQMNHTERTIDVLKMDIETYEWAVTKNFLDTGALRRVKQFLLEWHIFPNFPPRQEFPRLLAVLGDLHQAGFRLFHRRVNPGLVNLNWDHFNLQADMGYVNIHFVKS